MKKKQFKAESKRLLDLMINSIYTHKEIFLRELISNASDAIDKLYYQSLGDGATGLSRDDFYIRIAADKEMRTLTVSDNGVGMTAEELENNLGTIAKSGSLAFKNENEKKEDIDIIGQFGVGFYSAFMVAKSITVTSRAFGSDEAYRWSSDGADGYTVEPCVKDDCGTVIELVLKDDSDDENYSEFLDEYRLRGLVKKYSDYIRYPIKMNVEKTVQDPDDSEKTRKVFEDETLNSMVPIWRRNKNELTDEDYNNFYRDKFFDFNAPLRVIHSYVEGAVTYNALLFVPSQAPFNYYTREYEKGLKLYANGVLIMDNCADLLPDHFSFIKGLVDSQDLSLNISREMLQHDRQLKLISSHIEKKIKSELLSMLKNDREKYDSFFKAFGVQLKAGIYNSYGANKDMLSDLIMFQSSATGGLSTLDEYVERMPEEQKYIYYAVGESVDKLAKLPLAAAVRDKGYEIFYMTDTVDEFAVRMLGTFKDKEFRSVTGGGDLGIESDEEKKELEQRAADNKDMLEFIKDALGGKVKEVRLTNRLKDSAVCLTADGMLSLEMERVLASLPEDNGVKAERVLEINSGHAVFGRLCGLYENDKDKLKEYAALLYDQALLIEGMPIEDPVAFANSVCALMTGDN